MELKGTKTEKNLMEAFAGESMARSTLSREGDQVITTGLGGVFPPDVLVGVIKELTPEASGKSTLAVIQPGADPRTVRHVFIITNY